MPEQVTDTIPTGSPDWQLRITDQDGKASYGAAVLVAPGYAVTCAHVVEDATGGATGPGTQVGVDAPRGDRAWRATGTVIKGGWWYRDKAPWDIALLRLSRPSEAVPARSAAPPAFGERVRVVGLPFSDTTAGRWVTGVVAGSGGKYPEYVQIDADSPAGTRILPGFSGSGVRGVEDDTVVGIMCEATKDGRLGWMVPIQAIPMDVVPQVRPAQAEPITEVPDSPRAIEETAQAMTDLRTLLTPDSRQDFFEHLDKRVRNWLRADQDLPSFTRQLVTLAHGEYDVLCKVLKQLDAREQGSVKMQKVWRAAKPLLKRCP
ncbi:trypsin-like serine peptidase [Nocardiopsis sp. LOL_012]|uniref:trypsin-like serine peptidase n=1 Tax=Nocardiopsis sp. LOL_012 TaxID=3345409 RepID=UPI003A8A8E3C